MTKRRSSKHLKQSKQDKIQSSTNQANSIKSKSGLGYFLSERSKKLKRLPPVQDPATRAGQMLVIFFMTTLLLSWASFWDRFSRVVPAWLALIMFLAMSIISFSRVYWFIFVPDDRVWLPYRRITDWAFISVVIFFYFYGTGLYFTTLEVISTKILPFVSKTANVIITNLFGWIMSGLLGNAAYDGLKRILQKDKES